MFKWLERFFFGSAAQHSFQDPPSLDPPLTRFVCPPYRETKRCYLDELFESIEKKNFLDLELSNAEWILKYEQRLTRLQEKVASEAERAEKLGRNPERLKKLHRHLDNVRNGLGRN